MARILLTSSRVDAGDLGLDQPIAVVARGYPEPTGARVIDVGALAADPSPLNAHGAQMIVVGLSRLLTPSNRVRLGQVLLRPRPDLTRVSVDETLFVGDPWRIWWHFFATRSPYEDYTDSFRAESRWRNAHAYGDADPFSAEAVSRWGAGVVVSTGDALRLGAPCETVVEVDAEARAGYEREKEAAFRHEKTITAILRRLSAYATTVLPERQIPTPARVFPRPGRRELLPSGPRIVRTDLGVDTYLAGRVRGTVELVNAIEDGFRG